MTFGITLAGYTQIKRNEVDSGSVRAPSK